MREYDDLLSEEEIERRARERVEEAKGRARSWAEYYDARDRGYNPGKPADPQK